MLTFFTTAKPFAGHSRMIQRNATQSWKRIFPDVGIILFGDEVGAAETAHEFALRNEADVNVVTDAVRATPWREFREIPVDQWVRQDRPRAVIDCWRFLSHLDGVDGISYVRLGFGDAAERPAEAKASTSNCSRPEKRPMSECADHMLLWPFRAQRT